MYHNMKIDFQHFNVVRGARFKVRPVRVGESFGKIFLGQGDIFLEQGFAFGREKKGYVLCTHGITP